jgi:hypothetical protein
MLRLKIPAGVTITVPLTGDCPNSQRLSLARFVAGGQHLEQGAGAMARYAPPLIVVSDIERGRGARAAPHFPE